MRRNQRRLGGVVLRDRAAQGNAGVQVDLPQHGFQDLAAHVLEDHVDPVWAGLGQVVIKRLGPVVDGGVESQVVDDVLALGVAAANADHAAPLNFGNLPGGAANGSRGAGDHDGLSRARLPHVQDAVVGRQPGHAQHAQRGG